MREPGDSMADELAADDTDMPPPEELLDTVTELGVYERKILLLIARRLLLGQKHYGKFCPNIPKDWVKEEAEELADAWVYRAAADVLWRG